MHVVLAHPPHQPKFPAKIALNSSSRSTRTSTLTKAYLRSAERRSFVAHLTSKVGSYALLSPTRSRILRLAGAISSLQFMHHTRRR